MYLTWRDVYVGDNESKRLDVYVEEEFADYNIYLYFIPVKGKNALMTDTPLTLDETGHGKYYVPGEVTDADGYFQVQIIGTRGNAIAKSKVYAIPCNESIDDSHAVLPTGQVVSLVEVKEELDSLTASDVSYDDVESVGVSTVQEAIDYALTHGSGESRPVYVLSWNAETPEEIAVNLETINRFRNLDMTDYDVMLSLGNGRRLFCVQIDRYGTSEIRMYFLDHYDTEVEQIYMIYSPSTLSYNKSVRTVPDTETDFDPSSFGAASMSATAEYIDERIGTTGNLDPSSYASASEVNSIKSKIPVAASPTNQLADKNFVNSSVATNTAYFIGTFDSVAELEAYSGTLTNNDYAFVVKYNPTVPTEVDAYDRYKYNASTDEWIFEYELNNSSFTAAQWAAINSAITANLVTEYSDHVADATIHVTAAQKTAWNAKYDKPANGIPSSDMTPAVQSSLRNADTALQSVPSGYATETYVDDAIEGAIGSAIGGSY